MALRVKNPEIELSQIQMPNNKRDDIGGILTIHTKQQKPSRLNM